MIWLRLNNNSYLKWIQFIQNRYLDYLWVHLYQKLSPSIEPTFRSKRPVLPIFPPYMLPNKSYVRIIFRCASKLSVFWYSVFRLFLLKSAPLIEIVCSFQIQSVQEWSFINCDTKSKHLFSINFLIVKHKESLL